VAGVQGQHVDQQISARVLDKYNISKGLNKLLTWTSIPRWHGSLNGYNFAFGVNLLLFDCLGLEHGNLLFLGLIWGNSGGKRLCDDEY
jgi:hypothetical protein